MMIGPALDGAPSLFSVAFDVASVGYSAHEHFATGAAGAYAPHRHLVREGYTWVGVSAQKVGIDGGGIMPGLGLRQIAPERCSPGSVSPVS